MSYQRTAWAQMAQMASKALSQERASEHYGESRSKYWARVLKRRNKKVYLQAIEDNKRLGITPPKWGARKAFSHYPKRSRKPVTLAGPKPQGDDS